MVSQESKMDKHAMEDLQTVQKYSHKKLWSMLKLSRKEKTNSLEGGIAVFERRLADQIFLHFDKATVCALDHHKALWVRIAVPTGRQMATPTNKVRPTYFMHPPNTDYLLVANLKVSQTKQLTQTMMTVLNAYSIEQLHLKGRHIASLLQLVLNKDTDGAYSKYYAKKSSRTTRGGGKRSRSDSVDTEFDCHILQENAASQRQRKRHLEDNFGPGKQPLLEKVEFKLETQFKGSRHAAAMDTSELFHCRVKFEGTSVIEGIRNLARAGLAPLPMKGHMANLHTVARNTFVLRQRENAP